MQFAIFQFSLFGINTYVLVDPATKDCAIVDPGMVSPQEENALVNFIEENQLKVTHIINTHLHVDHAIGNAFATKKFHAPVLAHKSDEMLGSHLAEQAKMFGMSEEAAAVSINQYIEDGDVIEIGDSKLKVIHVPGHSQGSVALYDPEDGFVIAGDALFQGSIGRTDLPGGNHKQLIQSVKGKLMTLPENTVVFPGHGPRTTIGYEKKINPFLL